MVPENRGRTATPGRCWQTSEKARDSTREQQAMNYKNNGEKLFYKGFQAKTPKKGSNIKISSPI